MCYIEGIDFVNTTQVCVVCVYVCVCVCDCLWGMCNYPCSTSYSSIYMCIDAHVYVYMYLFVRARCCAVVGAGSLWCSEGQGGCTWYLRVGHQTLVYHSQFQGPPPPPPHTSPPPQPIPPTLPLSKRMEDSLTTWALSLSLFPHTVLCFEV